MKKTLIFAFLGALFLFWGGGFSFDFMSTLQGEEKPDYVSKVPAFTFSTTLEEQQKELETNPLLNRFNESREKLSQDRYRPTYHYVNPESSLNDPNGLCYWKGQWHLFYQAYPPEDSRQHWGHAVSSDLVHWKDLPLAIYPNPESHCFSGSIFIEEDRAIACYHGVNAGTMIAISEDPLLLNWKKVGDAPVIAIPTEPKPYAIYDPCIWKEGNEYFILSGVTQPRGELGIIRPAWHLFKSSDLENWEYVHQFVEDDYSSYIGDDGACPYFWPIGDQNDPSQRRHLLIHFSHMSGGKYLIGRYDREQMKFFARNGAHLNQGPAWPSGIHAPSAFPDGKGGVVAIFNMNPGKPTPGWDQIMSLPYQLNLMENDLLQIQPYEALKSLRQESVEKQAIALPANQEIVLEGIEGNSTEFRFLIEPKNSSAIELNFFRSPDREEYTKVSFYNNRGWQGNSVIEIDSSHSSLEANNIRATEQAQVKVDPNQPVEIRAFVDRSVLEVFVNNKQVVGVRVYPSREDSIGVSIQSRGADANLNSVEVWQMENIYQK